MKGKQILLSERGRIECYLISQLFSSTIDIHFFFCHSFCITNVCLRRYWYIPPVRILRSIAEKHKNSSATFKPIRTKKKNTIHQATPHSHTHVNAIDNCPFVLPSTKCQISNHNFHSSRVHRWRKIQHKRLRPKQPRNKMPTYELALLLRMMPKVSE